MPHPIAYRVHWCDDSGGWRFADYPQRARARGFVVICRARGWPCRIEALMPR